MKQGPDELHIIFVYEQSGSYGMFIRGCTVLPVYV